AIVLGGSNALKKDILPSVARGERLLALAIDEGRAHAPERIATRAERTQSGYAITGDKVMVLDGHGADTLIVAARGDDGLTLFAVHARAKGVTIERGSVVDSRNAARVRFEGVVVANDMLLDGGAKLTDTILTRAVAGLSAEMLGGIQEAFER